MSVLIKGGTVVNAELSLRADVLCDGGSITAVGRDLEAPSGATVIEKSVRGPFERFEISPGAITFYIGSRRSIGTIHYEVYHEAVEAMLREVLALQYEGDKEAADAFIEKYTSWKKEPHERLAKAMKKAETHRYTLVRYAALGE